MKKYFTLNFMRTISLVIVFIGVVGSFSLVLYNGRNNESILLIALFVGWVLSPFIALLIANKVSKRWTDFTRKTLYILMLGNIAIRNEVNESINSPYNYLNYIKEKNLHIKYLFKIAKHLKMNRFLYRLLFVAVLVTACKKDTILENPDWVATKYKCLVLDSSEVDYNTRAKFYQINESTLILSAYSGFPIRDCCYKLKYSNGEISLKNMKPLVYGNASDIKDISFPNNEIGFLLMNDREANTGIDSKIFHTQDSGNTWVEKTIDIRNRFRYIHFISADSGIALAESYIGICHEIYCTTNGGNNWQLINNEYFDGDTTYLSNFFFIPKEPEICFITCNKKLLYSINGGFSWQFHSNKDLSIYSFCFLNKNTGFLTNFNNVYKIDKIGGSFKNIYTTDVEITKILAINENEIYFRKWQSIYRTDNGFNTVKLMNIQDPYPNEYGDRLIVDFIINSRLGIAVDIKGTIYKRNN